jgi:hypothetical protein
MNRKIPLWFVLLLLWFAFIIALTFGWEVLRIRNSKQRMNTKADQLIISLASFPSLVKESFIELSQPSKLISPDLYPDISGLKTEKNYIDSNYVLLSTYNKKENQSVVKLIRLSDQKIIHQWRPNYDEIIKLYNKQNKFWPGPDKNNLQVVHPLLSPDGSIIFNNYLSPLIKIDKDSRLLWGINGIFYHSIERDADGNVWTASVINPATFLPDLLNGCQDDAITEISPDGKTLFRKSVAQILLDNGYRTLLLGIGPYEKDLVHLNEVQPALTSGSYWMKGDLLISLRNRSTVFLYRCSTNKILWLKTGPWLNQHDAEFIDSARVGVFGNNTVRMFGEDRLIDGYNEEYIFNFKTNTTETPYTEFLKKAKVSTASQGRANVLANGDLFIEETINNRLLRGNTKEIEWQYVDRIDKHSVAALSWSRFITKEEFKKLTFLKND